MSLIQFSSNTLVLTANQRLAQVIRRDYDHQQQAQNQLVWDTPSILPLRSWLQTLWQNQNNNPEQILSAIQEQQLWSQIIQETRQTVYPLLHVDNTAELVQQAWQLMHHYQVPLEKIKQYTTSAEVNLFVNWVEQFINYCQAHNWLSEAALPARLQTALVQQTFTLPKQIMLAGFDELPPAFHAFLQALNCLLRMDKTAAECGLSHLQNYSELELEITAMAQWAKIQIENNPHASIGCVVPQLTQYRAMIAHIFKQVLTAEQPFNISAGQSLSDFEVITTALQTLMLTPEKISLELMSALWQSPYLCQTETDINFGAILDAACRDLGATELPIAAIYSMIAKWQIHYPDQSWLKRLRAFIALRPANLAQLPSEWSRYFAQQLYSFGWPGGRGLNSLEYQIIARWQELLAELGELDAISGAVNRQTALHCLQRLARQTIFQPKTEADARIQILGVLESSGLHFDALWIMGLDDQNWPPAAKPNPFLPYSLQMQHHIPHSCAQRELMFAQTITQRLLRSAKTISLSCSATTADQPARFSRLIPARSANSHPMPTFPAMLNDAMRVFNAARREQISDQSGPAVTTSEKIRGGSGIFTQQAQCPFRAFAIYRLNAVALSQPELGISPLTHGILMHNALERLWQQLKNQQNLLAMSHDNLKKLIAETIEAVISDELSPPDSTFAQIEKQRLIGIISEWLTLEKQRPPFEVIEQEAERSIQLAGLNLRLKIDRIDQLSDGSQLLIDYKTGLTSIQAWLSERLQQPQLPLYAVDTTQQNHFAGVAFAQLHISKLSFKGLHAENLDSETYFPRGIISIDAYKDLTAPKTWTTLLAHWQTILQKLATDFYNGYAAVDPSPEGELPCQTCDLQSLCRVKL